MAFTLETFSARSPLMDVAANIYARVWGRDYADAMWIFGEYATFPHFYGYMAFADSHAVGFALGTESRLGQWWHDCVAQKVGIDHPALQRAWVLTELAVLPGYRDCGIGLALHDAILDAQPFNNLLLSTMVSNYGARRFYERQAWQYLHRGFSFLEGQEPYAVMFKKLHRP